MTPVFWLLRALNLAAALGAARLAMVRLAPLAAPPDLTAPAAAAAVLVALGAAAAFGGSAPGARARRLAGPGLAALDLLLVAWLAVRFSAAAGAFDLAFLLPAALIGVELGPWAGAAAGAAAAAVGAFLLASGAGNSAGGASFLPVAAIRGLFFVLVPAAAGEAAARASAGGAARARGAVSRLRAAQVGEYVSFVLFQLRDYLITISSLAEAIALSAPRDDAKAAERVERLRRAVGELVAKSSRLLGDKSGLTSSPSPTTAATDLPALCRAVVDEARGAFGAPGTTVTVLVDGEVPPARTDPGPIELALLAVLQNSLEACAARGAGAVTVVVRRADASAEIEVADDGGGIAEEAKALVFEPLAASRAGSHGMGLGLSMSRRFLERIGGGLRLKTRGGYTAALITVPLERELPKVRNEESTWAGRRAEPRPEGH